MTDIQAYSKAKTQVSDRRYIATPDETELAKRAWENHEFKKFAVDVIAGPSRRPRYGRTFYAHARNEERAIATVKRDALGIPSGATFTARLAGPRELGCVWRTQTDATVISRGNE